MILFLSVMLVAVFLILALQLKKKKTRPEKKEEKSKFVLETTRGLNGNLARWHMSVDGMVVDVDLEANTICLMKSEKMFSKMPTAGWDTKETYPIHELRMHTTKNLKQVGGGLLNTTTFVPGSVSVGGYNVPTTTIVTTPKQILPGGFLDSGNHSVSVQIWRLGLKPEVPYYEMQKKLTTLWSEQRGQISESEKDALDAVLQPTLEHVEALRRGAIPGQ